jgi:hypothetical protein
MSEASLLNARVVTGKIAMEITGCSRSLYSYANPMAEYSRAPFCLRIPKHIRTGPQQMFRNKAAQECRRRRKELSIIG